MNAANREYQQHSQGVPACLFRALLIAVALCLPTLPVAAQTNTANKEPK